MRTHLYENVVQKSAFFGKLSIKGRIFERERKALESRRLKMIHKKRYYGK